MAEQGFEKMELANNIYHKLLSLAQNNIITKRDELLLKNLKTGGHSVDVEGMLYITHHKDVAYEFVIHSVPPKHKYDYPVMEVISAPELENEFISLQEDLNTLQKERVKLSNYIRIMLNQCDTIADLHKVFPPSLHRYLPDRPKDSVLTVPQKSIDKINKLKEKYGQFVEELMFKNFLQT